MNHPRIPRKWTNWIGSILGVIGLIAVISGVEWLDRTIDQDTARKERYDR